jgi:hypothetical protein
MAKYNKEELKQIRLNNLAKGRMGQGRPKGSKNKVTAKRVNDMIIKFLDQEENKRKPKEEIIKEELKLNINEELKINDQIELPVEQKKQEVKEVQPQKENKVEPEIKEQLSKTEKESETEKKIKLFDFDF